MDEQEFDRLLKVARLKLSESEKKTIKRDIDEVIRYFDKIAGVAAGDDPSYQPIRVPTRFREDRVIPFKDVELLKKGSKLREGYIIGPKL